MIRIIGRNIIRFFVLIILQILVFDNIMLGKDINPYFYVIFIVLMPFETPRWMLLINAFILGFSIDIFSHTLGLHTAATVFVAFIRPYVLTFLSPRDGYEQDTFPRIHYYGFNWFAMYTALLVFFHHFALFFLEIFHFHDFLTTFLRVVLTTVITAITIIISQYFIFRK